MLPAVSIDESVSFWEALGFEFTLRQKAPNAYAVMQFDGVHLHLFGLSRLEPQNNFTTCLVIVSEVEDLHARFADRLRAHLGRSVLHGLPRLSRMRPGQSRFTVTDVSGNSVIFVKRGPEDDAAAAKYKEADLTPMQRAFALAERTRDFKADDAAAARMLDTLIERYAGDASPDYRRAVEARLDLAEFHDEHRRAESLRAVLAGLA